MIETPDLFRLRGIGLAPALLSHWATVPHASPGARLMRVTEVQREGLRLHDGDAELGARQLPALRNALDAEADAIAVGDWVLAERNALRECWVGQRLPPLNQLARRLHDGRDKVTRVVIVSNVDTALLVMGLDGDFNLRRLERYVALVRMAGVGAVVVLTKKDLTADAQGRLRQAQASLPPDVLAVAVDATGGEAREVLAPWTGIGQTLVLLGSSGAGKSTLTNSLMAAMLQDTGPNRGGDSRGRHTTTTRSLHVMPDGACVIDTPGLRTLRLDGDTEALDRVYGDVATLALQCRFRDCRHDSEPGCAVREGVGDERLHGYKKLQREARRDTQTALERKAQVQQWKQRSRAVRARLSDRKG